MIYPAAVGKIPVGGKVIRTDPNGKWVIFEDAQGVRKIQFDVKTAKNLVPEPLPPVGPGKPVSPQTLATVGPDGKVIVTEGMHRLEGAQGGAIIPPGNGAFQAFRVGLNILTINHEVQAKYSKGCDLANYGFH